MYHCYLCIESEKLLRTHNTLHTLGDHAPTNSLCHEKKNLTKTDWIQQSHMEFVDSKLDV